MTRATSVLVLVAVLSVDPGVLVTPSAGGPGDSPSPGQGGDLLLEGLDDLIGGVDAPPAEPPRGAGRPADAPSWLPNRKELDRLMRDSLEGKPPAERLGEDLGESPLVTLRSTMDRAGRLIATGDGGAETRPTQEKVITQLDELIKKMEKQCQNCQGGAGSQPKRQASRRSKPGQPKPGQQAGKKPGKPQGQSAAQRSSLRLGEAEAGEASGRRNADVIKRVWGRLPERLREQMLQSTTDEYLPEYRSEIEQYFQRLAEEPGE